jgi:hypothetical protein
MTGKKVSERIRIRRLPERARYARKEIYPIVDAALICQVGFAIEGQPFVIPMAFARAGDFLYLHGPSKGRITGHLATGAKVCVTITHLDGLVLAKSQFHHSMNYRSAVLFGTCREISEPVEKANALKHLVRHLARGQEIYAREGNAKELRATTILKFDIEEASAKVRKGPPKDAGGDQYLDLWSGVIDLKTGAREISPDPNNKRAIDLPPHIGKLFKRLKV